MPTLEDVKAYIKDHNDEDHETLEARIAKEFGMSREQAAQIIQDLGPKEVGDPNPEVPGTTVPNAAILAPPAGLVGSGPGYENPAAAPLAAQEIERQREDERDANRD